MPQSRFTRALALTLGLILAGTGGLFAAGADGLVGLDGRGLVDATESDPEVVVPPAEAPTVAVRAALDSLLYQYDVVELPLASLDRQVREGSLDVALQGLLYRLELEPNDLRGEGYREVLLTDAGPREVDPGPVTTFRGSVEGEEDSVVRLTATSELFSGYVRTGEQWVFVDPLREYVPDAPADRAVVYREEDVRPEASGLCGVTGRLHAVEDAGSDTPRLTPKGHTTLRRLQVATDADGEYYQRYGNPGTFDRIEGILNDVDGIYRRDLNLFISITFQQAWTDPSTDPYTSFDADTTLFEFRDWWNANRTGTTRDTAHLFSGKDFNGGTVGIAWVGVICNRPDLSYGVSQDLSSSFLRTQLTAHEIGHNLSASHDDEIGCASCGGFGPIMCSSLQSNGSNTFSSCSENAIDSHTHNNGSCLD
ncbi:MAG: M12 family metallo-peptidase [Thermoanaerobaculia bacterium]